MSLFNLPFKAFAEYLQTTDIRLLCNDSDHFPILLNEDVMFGLSSFVWFHCDYSINIATYCEQGEQGKPSATI